MATAAPQVPASSRICTAAPLQADRVAGRLAMVTQSWSKRRIDAVCLDDDRTSCLDPGICSLGHDHLQFLDPVCGAAMTPDCLTVESQPDCRCRHCGLERWPRARGPSGFLGCRLPWQHGICCGSCRWHVDCFRMIKVPGIRIGSRPGTSELRG